MSLTQKPVGYSELQVYIDILNDIEGKNNKKSYSSLVKDLLVNFGIRISVNELNELYEPNLEEIKKDLEIQVNNVC